jgi:hypothetical protein
MLHVTACFRLLTFLTPCAVSSREVLPCSHIKKTPQNVYEKINKKYECIVHIVFYQHAIFRFNKYLCKAHKKRENRRLQPFISDLKPITV